MTALLQLLPMALATMAVVEFFRHGNLIAEWRAKWSTTTSFFSRLMRCGFCLSYWVAAIVSLILFLPNRLWPGHPAAIVLEQCGYGLAVVRLANLMSDVTHGSCRSPKREEEAGNREVSTAG